MRFSFLIVCAFTASTGIGAPPDVSGEPLTAEGVVKLAAARAPEVLIAQTRLLEAKGRLDGARALGLDNPVVDVLRGSGESLDRASELSLQIPFGFGLHRGRRIAEADAEIEREGYVVADVRRRAAGLSLEGFYRVLHSEERKAIAQDRRTLAEELRRVASEKVRTGDAPRLELLVAEGELSRAESEVLSEEQSLAQARAELAVILGLSSGSAIEVSGELSDRTLFEGTDPLVDPALRVDVLAAESEVKASQAAVANAQSALFPGFAFLLSYEHSRDEDIVRPGLSISLPIFNSGQGARGEAKARRERAAVELTARRAAALAEAEGARNGYANAVASAREIEERGLPRAIETESLARESYEAGKLDLPGLLVVRANALDTRREYADRLLDAALAGVDLAVSVGALPTTDDRRENP